MHAEEARGQRDEKGGAERRTVLAAAVERSEPNEVENAVPRRARI